MNTPDDIFKRCEKHGEDAVRKHLARGNFCTHDEIPIVQEWLRRIDQERTDLSSLKRDAREEETLAIAKDANRLASEANIIARDEARNAARSARWAKYAAISAAIITAIAAREDIIWLISWLIKVINTP